MGDQPRDAEQGFMAERYHGVSLGTCSPALVVLAPFQEQRRSSRRILYRYRSAEVLPRLAAYSRTSDIGHAKGVKNAIIKAKRSDTMVSHRRGRRRNDAVESVGRVVHPQQRLRELHCSPAEAAG